MTTEEILTCCQELGVKLAPGLEGKLRVCPPPEELPEDLREDLKRHKQEVLAFLLAEKAEELRKLDYRTLYREVTETIPEDFPLVDVWLVENHPSLWQRIRNIDDELTRLEQEEAEGEVYRAKLDELIAVCQQGKDLREGTWGAIRCKMIYKEKQ